MIIDLARIFCQNTSIRGVGKIFKAPTACLRAMWLIYVLAMLIFLIYSTSRIFKDYMEYSTVIQTSWGLDDDSLFPSLTFCNHYPFSKTAKELWNKKAIMSPSIWNSKLRSRLKACVKNGTYECGLDNFLDDSKRMYYQNLSPKDSARIGHTDEDTILLCAMFRGSFLTTGNPTDCDITVKTISLPNYFNCFTVVPTRNEARINRLILVLNVGEKPDFVKHEQAFITDIFQQAHGVRMVVHEPGTYPDIEARGEQVEPGKMVEVSYQPIQVEEVNTPKKPCYEDNVPLPKIYDLKKQYSYSFESCISMKKSEVYLDACKCYFANLLRPGVPNNSQPYCGDILNTTSKSYQERRRCVMKTAIKVNTPTYNKELEDSACLRRCRYNRYTTRTSITKWRVTQWQVYWARKQLQALNVLYMDMKSRQDTTETAGIPPVPEAKILHAKRDVDAYVKSTNLTLISEQSNTSSTFPSIPTEPDDFVYIVLSRQQTPIQLEINKLTLTLNGLVSRIGGLCSLYLGLTCAFGVELIEFLYLIKERVTQGQDKTANNSNTQALTSERAYPNENNNSVNKDSTIVNRYSPMFGMPSTTYSDKSDDDSPWTPRIPLNSTPL